MSIVFEVLAIVMWIFILFMFARVVISFITLFARDWRPTGPMVVVLEAVFSVTDPPIRAVRKVVPPLTLGSIRLDLAFIIVFIAASILQSVFSGLA